MIILILQLKYLNTRKVLLIYISGQRYIEKYFVNFFVLVKTAKSPFEINWPLVDKHFKSVISFLGVIAFCSFTLAIRYFFQQDQGWGKGENYVLLGSTPQLRDTRLCLLLRFFPLHSLQCIPSIKRSQAGLQDSIAVLEPGACFPGKQHWH